MAELKNILEELIALKEMGVRVMILDIPTTLMDFSNMTDDLARLMLEMINNMLIELYATLAEAEMEKRENRGDRCHESAGRIVRTVMVYEQH